MTLLLRNLTLATGTSAAGTRRGSVYHGNLEEATATLRAYFSFRYGNTAREVREDQAVHLGTRPLSLGRRQVTMSSVPSEALNNFHWLRMLYEIANSATHEVELCLINTNTLLPGVEWYENGIRRTDPALSRTTNTPGLPDGGLTVPTRPATSSPTADGAWVDSRSSEARLRTIAAGTKTLVYVNAEPIYARGSAAAGTVWNVSIPHELFGHAYLIIHNADPRHHPDASIDRRSGVLSPYGSMRYHGLVRDWFAFVCGSTGSGNPTLRISVRHLEEAWQTFQSTVRGSPNPAVQNSEFLKAWDTIGLNYAFLSRCSIEDPDTSRFPFTVTRLNNAGVTVPLFAPGQPLGPQLLEAIVNALASTSISLEGRRTVRQFVADRTNQTTFPAGPLRSLILGRYTAQNSLYGDFYAAIQGRV